MLLNKAIQRRLSSIQVTCNVKDVLRLHFVLKKVSYLYGGKLYIFQCEYNSNVYLTIREHLCFTQN